MWLIPYHQLDHEKSINSSNYVVKVEEETCIACALCTKRCPMDALQLKNSTKAKNKFRKAAVVDPDLCIGCGVCAHKCPSNSIVLEQRETLTRPPKTARDHVIKHYKDLEAGRARAQQEGKDR